MKEKSSMKQLSVTFSYIKKSRWVLPLVVVAGVGIVLVACSGGGSASIEEQKEQLRSLPPMPSIAAQNATVLGVDINNNGVRDEVERMISERVPLSQDGSIAEYQNTLRYAKRLQDFFVAYEKGELQTREDVLKLHSLLDCEGGYLISVSDGGLAKPIADATQTGAGREKIMNKINALSGSIFGSELKCPLP